MVNKIGTVYSCGSNKRFSSRFSVDFWFQHEIPEEVQRTYWLKHCDYNHEEEVNSLNILNNNNNHYSSQKFSITILISYLITFQDTKCSISITNQIKSLKKFTSNSKWWWIHLFGKFWLSYYLKTFLSWYTFYCFYLILYIVYVVFIPVLYFLFKYCFPSLVYKRYNYLILLFLIRGTKLCILYI